MTWCSRTKQIISRVLYGLQLREEPNVKSPQTNPAVLVSHHPWNTEEWYYVLLSHQAMK